MPEEQLLAVAARVSDGVSDEASDSSDWDTGELPAEDGLDGTLDALKEIARVAEAYRALVRSDDHSLAVKKSPLGRWGHLELMEKLGEGAAAEVFRAHDTRLDSDVALKLFKRTRLTRAEKQVVLEEGRRHARVKHANIATIHDADEHDGRLGISMEYIDGSTLHDVVALQGPHGAEEAAHIGVELCRVVAAIHGKGLVHGDIKAQNVMREKGGRIVLMDFSTSRPLKASPAEGHAHTEGTPIYMAPELFEGAASSPESDVYALGVLLFYLATGDYPAKARTLGELRDAMRRGERQSLYDLRPDLPAGLSNVVHKAIARDPADRFQSAGELQQALRGAVPSPMGQAETSGSAEATEIRQADDVSTLVRTLRFAMNAAVAIAFLALLGYLNEFNFNTALEIPEKFTNYSYTTAAMVGLRSLSFLIVLGVMEAVAIAVLWGLVMVLGRDRARRLLRRVPEKLRSLDFTALSVGFALTSVAAVALTTTIFSDFLTAALASNLDANLSVLRLADCSGDPAQAIRFALAFSQLLLVLTVAWLVVFGALKPPALDPTSRFMKWVSAMAILVGLGTMSMPWRLIWNNKSPPIELGAVEGYVVARDDDELFVYAPKELAGQQHLTIRPNDPRITRLSRTPEYIFGEESCEEGVEE